MTTILHIAQQGFPHGGDIALATLRVAVGGFFACSGVNKLLDKQRHATLVATLTRDHVPAVRFNQWWVPAWELVGGASVALGLATCFMAAILLVICGVACALEGRARVAAYAPINRADRMADWLYLPEVLYGVMLTALVLAGGGRWQLGMLLLCSN